MQAAAEALAAGDLAGAEAAYAALLRARPRHAGAWLGISRVALKRGRPETALEHLARHTQTSPAPNPQREALRAQALQALSRWAEAEAAWRDVLHLAEAGSAAGAVAFPLAALRLTAMVAMWQGDRALEAVQHAIATAPNAAALNGLFGRVALLLGEGEASRTAWVQIRARLSALTGQDGHAALLSARLRFALGEHQAFRAEVAALPQQAGDGPLLLAMQGAATAQAQAPSAADARRKVFVIGLSKTGTTSLNAALQRLGFNAWHWANPITSQMLTLADADLADSLSDIPAADIMEALAARYPGACFILSVRPMDAWRSSFLRHHSNRHRLADFNALKALVDDPTRVRYGCAWRDIQERFYTRHPDPESAWAAHEERVARLFAGQPQRLLRFDLFSGDGWPVLCDFLRLPVPTEAFPHENAAPR